ncbi:uncharacterized protein LOC133206232 isoform X2 [Saccostrea echinata]|uniref:uncharacterized protein LOC133188332 isoform X2 n=1 Tax=Saccostrea echinata TaxID=191078 RepID=UPI002A813235|nr:uncharacterized protein LOC133188332 isoform X2 [Saccostrea echinata]XP_061198165.1 uncharacterized protein LOC133206232 isoform X2 [Saccostrea echinata]
MALVTVQRSPSPSNSTAESEEVVSEDADEVDAAGKAASPPRQRRTKTAAKRLKKFFHTVRFISKLRPFSESYFTVKGAALILPQNEQESGYASKRITKNCDNEIQSHLQSMFYLLRPQDTIKIAVRLETTNPTGNPRYMAVVSCVGRQDEEESVILGIDCQEKATIGLVYPIFSDTSIKLDGDGGFIVSSDGKLHVFKPVSVQAMWSALQSLNKIVKMARDNRHIPAGLSHTWTGYYESSSLRSSLTQITEWHTNEDVEFFKSMPVFVETDDEESQFKKRLNVELKNVMMRMDLEEATCKEIRQELEEAMGTDLSEYKSYVDQEMMRILGQMDSPTKIEDYLYLGSEWNASNMEELHNNGVGHILNVSREIDNFFPGCFVYQNIREWDSEETDLMKHWDKTFMFIKEARNRNSKVLVHCKMGISRSASTVMAYLMKEHRMSRQEAYDYVKEKRSCIMPNSAFWKQLETYEGILQAKRKLELFKSKSQQDLLDASMEEDDVGFNRHHHHHLFTETDMTRCHSMPGGLDNSVFYHPDYEPCHMEPDMEAESRSADSAEDSLSDHPSPKPEEEEASKKDLAYYIGEEDDGHQSEGMEEIDWNKPMSSSLPTFKIIKPDESWIRGEAEKEEESEEKKSDVEVKVIAADNGEMSKQSPEEEEKVSKSDDSAMETNSPFVHLKENIPWNPGTVKKTKENIEGKKTEPLVGGESFIPDQIIVIKGAENVGAKPDLKLDLAGVTVSESSDYGRDTCTPTSESSRNSGSVYEKEEIPLAPGTVKRTLKEIEEKHGFLRNKDLPPLPLQRSESLKSPRDKVRRRRMDRERRKTCNPVLVSSPRSPEEEVDFEWRRHSTGETFSSKPGTEEKSPETKQAVYKLMGEEITVEKGIVRKQREGIEGKSRQSSPCNDAKDQLKVTPDEPSSTESEVLIKDDLKSENVKNVPNNSECASDTNISANNNATNEESTSKQSVNEIKSNFEKSPSCGETPKHEVCPKIGDSSRTTNQSGESPESPKCSFAERKKTFETPIPLESPEVSRRPKRKSQSEARFDPETLKLIREIGSALMNSPAKCKIETDTDLDSKGNFSLVKHFVRDIERNERKPDREIIIIDKESQARRKRNWRFSAPTPTKEDPSEEKSYLKRTVAKSTSQPISLLEDSDKGTLSQDNIGSQPQKLSDQNTEIRNEVYPLTLPSGTPPENCTVSEDHIDKVHNLVGKFQPVEFKGKMNLNVKSDTLEKCGPDLEMKSKSEPPEKVESLATAQNEANKESDSESSDNTQLRYVKENLRKTNLYCTKRPQSAELKRSNTTPGCTLGTLREKVNSRMQQRKSTDDADSEVAKEKRKVRKLQGRSHPLTKLEYRRNNPFYSTM